MKNAAANCIACLIMIGVALLALSGLFFFIDMGG